MSIGWNEVETPAPPRLRSGDWVWVAWRAPLALLATLGLFGLFLILKGVDRLARLALADPPALAPRIIQAWATVVLFLLGLRFQPVGAPMEHPGALVANHASWLDIVTLQRSTRGFFVSKAEVAGWPVIGFIGRAIGTVFIERRATEARRQNAVIRDRLLGGDRLCLFPEGTSTDGRRVLPFKSSLFEAFFEPELRNLVWVQPVSIAYRPRAGLPKAFYGWWGDMDFGAHLVTVMARSRGGVVEATFHPPLRVADFADRKALAAAAGSAVADGFARLIADS
ncbi:1-acyl-sn-glycerol-3-phosphate acyltransferase [uncultured Amaricoccus sp.]|uniref:lysophospholipid acyltransferase family protein n=1 Tax=uncultured Amaricoccus sp. TaxID=339341 RepID=UPI0026261C4F|nr:lysophospholipid acyltransferase family protein [uncultured Amaricoccus sp.]